jgi:sorbitol-specific phosphotransferase system component IIC
MTHDAAKTVGDTISLATVVGTLADILPSLAALISIVWGLIRIFETETVQRMIRRAPSDRA